MNRRLWRWGPVAAVMAAIFTASSIPDLQAPPAGMSDKTAHVIAYALLGAVVLRARSDLRWAGCTWRAAWQSWLVATGYGVTDELHQWFVPGRMSSAADWVADAVGAAAAVVAIVVLAIAMGRQRRAV